MPRYITQLDVGPQSARSCHMVHPYFCQSGISTECQLIIFGGEAHVNGDFGDRVHMADLRILTFGMNALKCQATLYMELQSIALSQLKIKVL